MYVREVCMHDVGMWVYVRNRMYVIVDIWKFVHVWYVSFYAHVGVYAHSYSCERSWRRKVCYISHVFVYVILTYRRVFDFTVSNVSNVSTLYFRRVYTWHVYRHRNVSCVQNQAMYTLWWMMCEIGDIQSEHDKCSFLSMIGLFCYAVCHWFLCSADSIRTSPSCPCNAYEDHVRYTCDIYHDFAYVIFYIEEFSKSSCPTCPTCQPYILVGIVSDTFVDTVMC